jgi:hypothetical protein
VAQAKAGQAPPSFSDALGEVYMAVANAKLSQDADLKFLNQLEMVVIGRLKHSDQQQPGGAQPPGPAGAPGGGAPQGPPPAGAPPGGPPPGGMAPNQAIPRPDMDEVRKTVAQETGP